MESSWPLDFAAAAPWLGRFSLHTTRTSIEAGAEPAVSVAVDEMRGLLGALPDDEIDSNRDH
jgi:hypothetical protein